MNRLMQFFKFDHLPPNLQAVSGEVFSLACKMDAILPENAEKTAGLRKLLEAKDCFVRSVIEEKKGEVAEASNAVAQAAAKGFSGLCRGE